LPRLDSASTGSINWMKRPSTFSMTAQHLVS
jgi:hypothetical protein